jgi:hypothetical protein
MERKQKTTKETKMKNTNGKWKASKRYDLKKNLVGISIDDTEKKIGVMTTYSSKQLPMDEVQANANLIASAPELLTACKYALGVLESVPEEYAELIADILDESVDTGMIEDAILKAEGK